MSEASSVLPAPSPTKGITEIPGWEVSPRLPAHKTLAQGPEKQSQNAGEHFSK